MRSSTRRPSAGTLIGTLALVFAFTGAAVALPGQNKVNSGDIKNGQVKTKDLNKKAVAPKVKVQSASKEASTNLLANSTVTVLTKSVPAGKYAVSAKTNMFTNGDDTFSCRIEAGDTQVDEGIVINAAAERQTVSMLGVANVPQGDPLRIECSAAGDIGSVFDVQLVAIPAG
jgi:hypothetical protein